LFHFPWWNEEMQKMIMHACMHVSFSCSTADLESEDGLMFTDKEVKIFFLTFCWVTNGIRRTTTLLQWGPLHSFLCTTITNLCLFTRKVKDNDVNVLSFQFMSQDLSVVGVDAQRVLERLRRWQKISGMHILHKKSPL
jgi:hypothetical protein